MALTLFKKKVDEFDYESLRTCKTCESEFKGRYCNKCGEKVTERYERSILHFLDNLLNAFTFLDGKFIKSLKLLVLRPGQLSKNISDGRQVPYMKMISLFFVTNFFYFFFPVFDSYNSTFKTQAYLLGAHSEQVRVISDNYTAEHKISIQDFEETYNNHSTNLSKILIIMLVIMFSVSSLLVNYSKGKFYIDHLLFGLELYSFHILINLVMLANVLLYLIKLVAHWGWNWQILLSDNLFSLLALITLFYWLVKAEKNFFQQKWYWAIPKAVLLYFLMIESVYVYRVALFYITVQTM